MRSSRSVRVKAREWFRGLNLGVWDFTGRSCRIALLVSAPFATANPRMPDSTVRVIFAELVPYLSAILS
jgi:hypothetical protein